MSLYNIFVFGEGDGFKRTFYENKQSDWNDLVSLNVSTFKLKLRPLATNWTLNYIKSFVVRSHADNLLLQK